MMYFLISLIFVETTILVVTGFLYMRQLYLLSQYINANGLKNYLSFKESSVRTIVGISIVILVLPLEVCMFLSKTLTNIMNSQAIIITVVGGLGMQFISKIPIPNIDLDLKRKLPWAIVTTQNQPKLLSPENIKNTLKKLEKLKSSQEYDKKYLKDIKTSLKNLISSEFEKVSSELDQAANTIVGHLIEFNNSRIIENIKEKFFNSLLTELSDTCASQENLLYGATIIYKALDAEIILKLDGSDLDKIFENWFKEIEKFSQEENNFQDSLLKKRQIFELYVKCLEKLIKQWEKPSDTDPKNIQSQKETIGNLAWGNNGIMNMFSRIWRHIDNNFKSPDQENYYYEEFADKVIETLSDQCARLSRFPAPQTENYKGSVREAVKKLLKRYPNERETIQTKLADLLDHL